MYWIMGMGRSGEVIKWGIHIKIREKEGGSGESRENGRIRQGKGEREKLKGRENRKRGAAISNKSKGDLAINNARGILRPEIVSQ